MAKLPLYSIDGKHTGTVDVSDAVFAVPFSSELVHQVLTALRGNIRQPLAHTKIRSERRGGGKKPWRQKGTGNARHGSIRSPIWRKGGVTFGPRNERVFTRSVNKKVRRLVLRQCLSSKSGTKNIVVVEDFTFTEPSTSKLATFLDSTKLLSSSVLLITKDAQDVLVQSATNIPRVSVTHAEVVNALDVSSVKYLVFARDALETIEDRFRS